jgi:hypothetical protein
MHQEWIEREIGSFAATIAKLMRPGMASVEVPIAALTAEQNPPPRPAPVRPLRPRRARRRKHQTRP